MAGKTINPTRMELTRLKAKQKTALRGHKLLKDKRDGLMKQFMQEVRRTRQLRKRVEEGLAQANAAFTVASAVMSPEMLEQALMAPRLSTEVTVDQRNIMSIAVPVFHRAEQETQPDLACYGFAQTSGELDDALQALNRVYSDLLELAQAVQREGEEKRRAQQPTSKEAPDKKPSILAKLKAQPAADTPSLKSAPKRSAEREL